MFVLEHFLLNVFFILFPLLFYQFQLNEKIMKRTNLQNLIQYLLFGIPMILCMFFPVIKDNGMIYDLRVIPLVLACYYTNFFTSFMLLLTLLISRTMLGLDTGAYITAFTASFLFLTTICFAQRLHHNDFYPKILKSALLFFVGRFIGKLLMSALLGLIYFNSINLIFFGIESVFFALLIYIIECIRRNAALKEELLFAEKMKIVSVMSASVAHEIRNPLTVIRGFVQLLHQDELKPEKRKMYGTICLEELNRAQEIINDYLALARPYPELTEKLDIGEEVNYVSKVLGTYANLKGVTVECAFDPDLFVVGDRQKLRQSIINIAKNGVEAMEQRSGVLKLEARRQKGEVVLSIADSGVGMTIDQVHRLGTPYFSTKEKGTGLGTMVSFSILKNMKGKVDVKSEEGKGTIFHISFPLAL